MKTNELIRAALNWAVAKCEGLLLPDGGNLQIFNKQLKAHPAKLGTLYTPSTDWAQGGLIIEREFIKVDPRKGQWEATIWNEAAIQNPAYGPTPLIAAMRCYVASKLGDTVEVPPELLE